MKSVIAGAGVEDVTFSLRHDGQMFVNGNVGIGIENPNEKLSVGGSISSRVSTHEGGVISLINPLKNGKNADVWRIYNMTGGYGNSLQFWNYSPDGSKSNSRLKISDEGDMVLYGKFEAKEVKITESPTADFVFESDYALPSLKEVEQFVREKKHLPEVASAKEMEEEGVDIGKFQIKLLQKIEELTLYIIEQDKKIQQLEKKIGNIGNE